MPPRDRHVHIEGLEELEDMASRIAPREARNLARATVHWIAGQARNRMRKRAPKRQGTLRRAIVSRRRRGTPTEAVSDVRITHGRGVKHDAWYWHFIEFGTLHHAEQPFIVPTVEEMTPDIPRIYREEFGRRLEKKLAAKAKQ